MSDIRTPTASAVVNIPGGAVIEEVTLSAFVGQYPSIQMGTHPKISGDEQAIEIFSSTATEFMGQVQSAMFAARNTPDVSVVMRDGNNSSISTRGYSVSPGYSVGAGSVNRAFVAIGEAALLSNLNPSIYRTVGDGFTPKTGETIPTVETSTSPAVRLIRILQKLKQDWTVYPLPREGTEYQIAVSADRVNEEAINILSAIVTRSRVALPSWSALASKPDEYSDFNKAINDLIQTLLQMSNSDFLSTLQNFCSQFQLQYVPSFSDFGTLIRMEDKVNGPTTNKVAEVASIDISAGNIDTLPVQQVLVTGSPYIGYAIGVVDAGKENEDAAVRPAYTGLYAYPSTPYTGGKIVKVGLPPYFPSVIGTFSPKAVAVAVQNKPNLDMTAFESQLDGLRTTIPIIFKEGVEPVIKRHCRNIFADLAIGGSVISINTGLDLSWTLGQRYNVSARGGNGPLFAGFLAGVSHRLSGGQRSSATTTLSFTHVQCNGFTLQLD
jgi:hypothetical protein